MNEAVEKIQYAIQNRQGVYPDDVTTKDLREAGCELFVMPIPSDFKKRRQYLGDTLAQMTMAAKPKDHRLARLLYDIGTTLSYLLNSTSYKEGELQDYDAAEVSKRLGHWYKENKDNDR